MTELKPCPFCGYEGIARKPEHCLASDDYYTFVDCTNCDHVSHDGAGDTPEEAVQVAAEAWNARYTRTSAWVSVETPPKIQSDLPWSVDVLGCGLVDGEWEQRVGYYRDNGSWQVYEDDYTFIDATWITLWQPLPAPPTGDKEG